MVKGILGGMKGEMAGVAFTDVATSGLTIGNVTAVELTAGLVQRTELTVQNLDDTNNLYICEDTDAIATQGIRVAPGELLSLSVNEDIVLYGLADGANTDVRILELK